jgi:hypothetical protein
MSDIAAKIEAKKAEIIELKRVLDEKMKAELTESAKFFFEETGLEAVIWNQYTPSFNDGDPCTFTLGEAIFIRHGFDPEELQSADEYEDDELYGTVQWSSYKENDELGEACKQFSELLSSVSDILEQAYGEYGVTVYMTKDKTYEAEYDCGY